MDFRDRRDLYNGFGDGLARAFELAATPLIFGFLGWLLDRWIGTVPVFTLILGLTTLTYMFFKMWREYDLKMQRHERQIADLRSGGPRP